MSTHFGIPTLIENPSLEQSLMLCSELELDFVELNMSLPEYQIPNQPICFQCIFRYGYANN
ncbi:hypothetical protein R83H12_01791 [Fibrobacteria bacterium R8-3-H12]